MLDDLPNLMNAIQDVIPIIENQPHLDAGRHTRKLLERLEESLAACYAMHADVKKQHVAQQQQLTLEKGASGAPQETPVFVTFGESLLEKDPREY